LVYLDHVENDPIKGLNILIPFSHLIGVRATVTDLLEARLLSDDHLVHKLEDFDQWGWILRSEEK